jgi:hypothetical protein
LVEVDEPTGGSPATPGAGSAVLSGGEQSAQVQQTAATPGSGNVIISGGAQWATVASASTAGTTNITVTGALQQSVGITPGLGSVTIGGTEKSIAAVDAGATATLSGAEQTLAATSGTGSVTINGSLQSTQVQTQAAAKAQGSITINGSERSFTNDPCADQLGPDGSPMPSCPQTVYDWGTVAVTINGILKTINYGQGDSGQTVASNVASAFGDNGTFKVTSSSNVVLVTADAAGTGGNSITLSGHCQPPRQQRGEAGFQSHGNWRQCIALVFVQLRHESFQQPVVQHYQLRGGPDGRAQHHL